MKQESKPTDPELLGKPFAYRNLVQVQSGSVVSRTIINKKSGTVSVFAFDKGESLSEHTAPFDALVEIIEGKATITIEGKNQTVEQGQQIILPANKPHALSAPEPFKMVLVMIRV